MNIFFTKMHGAGNDFIVIDNFNGRIKLAPEEIALLCDRHKGIGADGLILVETSKEKADCFMNYYNSDGTSAEMCGNGIRCVALFLRNDYLKEKESFQIETRAGIKKVTYEKDGTFSVEMGQPDFESQDFPKEKKILGGVELDFVSMGNPHAVAVVEKLSDFDFEKLGPLIENSPSFPKKINFELVEKIGDQEFEVLVWERGSGKTLACGTGACAVFAITQKNKEALGQEVKIKLPGGELFVKKSNTGAVILRGGAESSFRGEVSLS